MRFEFKIVLWSTITVMACMLSAGYGSEKQPSIKGGFEFRLANLEGKTIASDSLFNGKVGYVTIWGTWCAPCLSEIPVLIDLQEKYGESGLVIVAIAFEKNNDVDSRQRRLREFAKKYGVNYLILDGGSTTDFSNALPMIENVKGLPIEIILDRSGSVVTCRNGYGYSDLWARKLDLELQKLLSFPKKENQNQGEKR